MEARKNKRAKWLRGNWELNARESSLDPQSNFRAAIFFFCHCKPNRFTLKIFCQVWIIDSRFGQHFLLRDYRWFHSCWLLYNSLRHVHHNIPVTDTRGSVTVSISSIHIDKTTLYMVNVGSEGSAEIWLRLRRIRILSFFFSSSSLFDSPEPKWVRKHVLDYLGRQLEIKK